MNDVFRDLRIGLRMLRRSPLVTAAAVVTLALGIGGTTAVLSVADGVLFDPMSFPESERLVRVPGNWSYDGLLGLRRESRTLESVGWYRGASVAVTGLGEPERIRGEYVSASYFDVLRARPAMGRLIEPADAVRGGDHTAVLSHRYWQRRFASDPEIVGQTVVLNNTAHTIVGVMPEDFRSYWDATEVWISPQTMPYGGLTESSAGFWVPIARLDGGTSLATAQDELRQLVVRLADVPPTDEQLRRIELVPLASAIVGEDARRLIWWLLGAVCLVLLIAAANVAGLQLARASRRGREMAIRAALGGGRRRLLEQLLVENMMLATLGGACGILVALGILRFLKSPSLTPFVAFDIELNGFALSGAALVTVGAGLLAGLVPALRGSRGRPGGGLREGGRAGIGGRDASRFRSRLVVMQMAMAVTLLIGASLLLRTAAALNEFELGFDAENLLTGETRLTAETYADATSRRVYLERVVDRLSRIPGVAGATLMKGMPFAGDWDFMRVREEGSGLEWEQAASIYSPPVAEGFFELMGIPLIAGRTFERTDGPGAERVFVVSRSFAEQHFDGASAVGRRLETPDGPGRIVGVVENTRRDFTTRADFEPVVYEHYLQDPPEFFSVLIRTEGAPESYRRTLLEAFWDVDPNQPLWEVMTLKQRMADVARNPRFFSVLLGGFAALAVVLAAVGLYAVMAHSVGSRQRELGLRIAVGAGQGPILRMVLVQGLALAAAAALVGVGAAAVAARFLSSALFGIEPFDVVSFAAGPIVLIAVAAVAAYFPARRATRIDPMTVLRAE